MTAIAHDPIAQTSSAQRDAEYAAAVRCGDRHAALKLVRGAAREAGFAVGPVFHATDRQFTTFRAGFRGWSFFAIRRDRALGAARCPGKPTVVLSVFVRANRLLGTPDDRVDYQTIECARAESVFAQGYDAAWVSDEAGRTIAVRHPHQIKSAALAEFDDAGALIPLSRRFDRNSDDIRGAV